MGGPPICAPSWAAGIASLSRSVVGQALLLALGACQLVSPGCGGTLRCTEQPAAGRHLLRCSTCARDRSAWTTDAWQRRTRARRIIESSRPVGVVIRDKRALRRPAEGTRAVPLRRARPAGAVGPRALLSRARWGASCAARMWRGGCAARLCAALAVLLLSAEGKVVTKRLRPAARAAQCGEEQRRVPSGARTSPEPRPSKFGRTQPDSGRAWLDRRVSAEHRPLFQHPVRLDSTNAFVHREVR